jgi:ribosomal protein S16
LNQERIHFWLKRGAHPTTTVKSLLKKANFSAGADETPATESEKKAPQADSSA